jgi:hypothetical protein
MAELSLLEAEEGRRHRQAVFLTDEVHSFRAELLHLTPKRIGLPDLMPAQIDQQEACPLSSGVGAGPATVYLQLRVRLTWGPF